MFSKVYCALLLFSVASWAFGAERTESQTVTFGMQDSALFGGVPDELGEYYEDVTSDTYDAATITQFDPAKGTLLRVEVTWTALIDVDWTISMSGDGGASCFDASPAEGPGVGFYGKIGSMSESWLGGCSVSSWDYPDECDVIEVRPSTGGSASSAVLSEPTYSPPGAQWIGTGSLGVNVHASMWCPVYSYADSFSGEAGYAVSGSLEVTYVYDDGL